MMKRLLICVILLFMISCGDNNRSDSNEYEPDVEEDAYEPNPLIEYEIPDIEELPDIETGKIEYVVPEEAVIDEPFTVVVRVSRDEAESLLMSRPGYTHGSDFLLVGLDMAADLDGSAFDVELRGQREKVLLNHPVKWVWEVCPRISGRQSLFLFIYTKIDLGDRNYWDEVLEWEKQIEVEVVFGSAVREKVQELSIEWLWTAILVPIAGFIIALIKRHRRKKKEKKDGYTGTDVGISQDNKD